MRRCTRATVALLGWYLIAPPYHRVEMSVRAPLSQWQIIAAFDTAADCESARGSLIESNADDARQGRFYFDPESKQPITTFSELFRCIATDDPRLKGN